MKPGLYFCILLALLGTGVSAADRYEAENAIVDENSVLKTSDDRSSGGFFVAMKEGNLSFTVTVSTEGFYALWACYSQPYDVGGKIQNFSVNGISKGQVSFAYCDSFVTIKASPKIKLSAGANTIEITKSWGWIDLDFIEITPYIATEFSIRGDLVSPNSSENALKVYGFLREQFQKKIISGVMTNTVMLNDGKYTPNSVESQTEVAWIINASGKTPALLGLDFMHATGLNSEGEWYKGYTSATLALAQEIFNKGGIPAYCWHWKDPGLSVETFYSPSSGNTPNTQFNLNDAFSDSTTYTSFNTSSAQYQAIIRDLDVVADYLKTLAQEGIPVLWRPLHEASGKWFWWGYKGSAACKALYILMFDRFTNYHGLDNLIWVWTTDEATDALNWYPGDSYVDIIGRDYYFYPRIANHGSLAASFEKVKDIFGGTKIIALSENGSIPYPDSLESDEAGWSYFMPWYGDYTMDGWAHDNTAADWNAIMNHNYVITLDKMPGWSQYTPPLTSVSGTNRSIAKPESIVNRRLPHDLAPDDTRSDLVNIYTVQGSLITTRNSNGTMNHGSRYFGQKGIANGTYIARFNTTAKNGGCTRRVLVSGE